MNKITIITVYTCIWNVLLLHQDETAEEKASALFTSEVLTQLASSNWKERLAAVEKMTQVSL